MKYLKNYLCFCKKLHNLNIPKLKFKALNERYNDLYKKIYNIDENDINKASFIVFLTSFIITILLSIFFIRFNILIISLFSTILSLILSYRFNLILYNAIIKKESLINAMLYLIKIDFSLIQKTLKENSDYSLNFIKLIKDYNLPISYEFKLILKKIHEGAMPENELIKVLTPSKDFDKYLKDLLVNNFNYNPSFNDYSENDLEKKFKIYLRELQSRISILFFIGFFFPLGICFLILFQLIKLIFLLFFIPLFFLLLNILFRKFVKKNTYMIGVLDDHSKLERRKFNEFLQFLKSFANNLKRNVSPEQAFLKSYTQNKNQLVLLSQPIKSQLSRLLNFNCSFNEMVQFLKLELKSIRYIVILNVIEKFIAENAYYSSEKIFDILTIISKHQNLENKLEIIIKGEKFKVFFFIFLLPILIGAISGMFPFFVLITENIDINNNTILSEMNKLVSIDYLIIIFFVLLSSVIITSNYFLNIINHQNKPLIIFILILVFFLAFLTSFMNIMSFI
ncbi:hypothetical protein LCGC14_1505730 [marine sediment metagenome]|uniref:Uncharacterized protein n=1 Tax=marine sediment metagenome TaxID=412755 RepID=A0A0F9LI38_9ZZZZ